MSARKLIEDINDLRGSHRLGTDWAGDAWKMLSRVARYLEEMEADRRAVLGEVCHDDEKHCVCVLHLRAENKRLRAQPRIHPLAYEVLVRRARVAEELRGSIGSYDIACKVYAQADESWQRKGCPLLAEGDAETPVVGS